ncbi:3,4-dihydroxy-2-butanone 4-phosphate synthase [Metallosphaera tengchongensis]|uniref:3,4-dihydroxy-2-butanone 4-phosphate synthase n=1 Tax=Metallosphaera tengchongensis TaxID=1532350 RepID=A0A6N0P072_9CREN|nr:3,4-dihydroxy-2-butanone-4-phosphate synthase [Metallosphaera tengchongensis]QKR01008.1 3,4-dihydroxy-2-butanone 4-phosphate synthase [Metallosphaera tengchongensis]
MNRSVLKKELESGLPILVYDFDGREEEVDMVFYGGAVSWKSIRTLRSVAGGLICYATGMKEAESLGLPFQVEILRSIKGLDRLVKKPVYNDEPAFSLWINHVKTTTGISDRDRALTVQSLHEIITGLNEKGSDFRERFYQEFYSPGHVPLLISRGIGRRKGHTELTVELMNLLGLERSVVFAEMLDEGISMKKDKVMDFAKYRGFIFIEGKEILKEVSS